MSRFWHRCHAVTEQASFAVWQTRLHRNRGVQHVFPINFLRTASVSPRRRLPPERPRVDDPQAPLKEQARVHQEHEHGKDPEWKDYKRVTIIRPVLFSAAVVVVSFGVASYMRAERRWEAEQKGSIFAFEQIFGPPPRRRMDESSAWPEPISRIKGMILHWWESARPSQQTAYAIIGINTAVFLLWRIPSLQPFMLRHFAHHPLSGRSYTLLTSVFSHESFLHLTFNMYALLGFAPLLQERALESSEEMVAFYLSSGVLASLGSHLVTTIWLRRYRSPKPSVGASGAIWAILAGCASCLPHIPVGIIFLPGIQFTLGELIPALVGLDVIGLIRGWQFFDHAAHLTGAGVGYMYTEQGRLWWKWWQRKLDEYHRQGRI
ncbi:hypothetical protein SpCBS45565_g05146 [Spizellomyces sp. 'palustris']|nr:hypothetical protein SpCBS45565_g05146 [Spizellomyces sp. 'palustris']